MSLRAYCSYLATTQASRLEPNCKWTAEALILTCLKGTNMNGENDKLIRDFTNAFEKKGVKAAMKDGNLAYQVLAAGRKTLIESSIAPERLPPITATSPLHP